MLLGADVILPFEQIRVIIAILGVAIGSYFDLFNDKNVPELFLYGFLAIAFIANLVAFDSVVSMYAIGTAVVVFGAFYILYKLGQLGGADVYLMAAIALLIPTQPQFSPFLVSNFLPQLPFMLNIILASGLSLMAYMLLRSIPIAFEYVKTPQKLDKKSLFGALAIIIVFVGFSTIALQSGLLPQSYFVLISGLVILSVYFTLFKEAINDTMIEWTNYKHVMPEDIIAVDRMDKKIVTEHKLGRLVDGAMHERMKKIHGDKIALYKHLPPFIPHILIGLVFSVLFGNLVIFLTSFF